MTNLNSLTISEARDKLKSREISSLELTNSCLSAIDAADALGAFVHKTPELAIEQAKSADERLKKENAPDLCGIPWG
jgi:aspartyl/glutamyl-tRNA(Asn/Gln) amidotransferase subunit A (EC 6.3.5.-)